ncbi:MAG: ABC transporter substrate-binding protein [Thermodesulfobacteriota bacterium]
MIRKSLLFALVISLFLNVPTEGKDRLLNDETGRKVKIPCPAKRIISLAPSITEILFALGLNEEIIAITNFCDYPKAVLGKPRIGGFVNPDTEKIVSLKPDLIIGIRDGNRMDTVDRLNDFGFPVYLIDPKGFDGVMGTIKNIGEVVGREQESRRLIKELIDKRENMITLTRSLSKPRVFFQVGDVPLITVGKGTLGDDLIRLAGGRSISENELVSYPSYSIETILAMAPEMIIISSMETKKDHMYLVKKWQNWKSIPAVKMNAIHVIDSNLVDRPTPRIAEGLDALVRIIHPEAFKEKAVHQSPN